MIPENIKTADAPVRYPFLWNAPRQDKTQWPGFAKNGSDILGLARNVGEVLGVFATFEPKRQGAVINFLNGNSTNFDGLSELENLVKRIGPPKWPWKIDAALAIRGKMIFERDPAEGGCSGCHGIEDGEQRFPFIKTWRTVVQNVGTDTREYDVLAWKAKTGVLNGAYIPFATAPLKETDQILDILATSVIGSIAEHLLAGGVSSNARVATASDPGSSETPESLGAGKTTADPAGSGNGFRRCQHLGSGQKSQAEGGRKSISRSAPSMGRLRGSCSAGYLGRRTLSS